MRVLTLASYDLKRLARNRPLWVALFALPLALTLIRCVFASMAFSASIVWVCPVACFALTAGVLWVQMSVDQASGLMAGLRSTPVTDRELTLSRVLAGGAVYLVQMAVLVVILAIRF